jgi:hypothetical protein
MTDEHGPDSDPLHEDASHEEHAQPPAESAGTWSDDHPPVDDFSDTATASEETAMISEEASEETSGEETPPPASPSRSMLPLFAGIGGILLVGAMIYWQFGHSSPPAMITQTQAPKSAASVPLSSNPSPKQAPGSGKIAESDITALYKAPPELASPPIPSPSSATSPTTSPTMPSAAPPTPAITPNQVNPSVPLASAASAVASAPPAPSAPPVDARINTLTASVNDLQKSLEATTQEINKLATMMAATQAMPPVSGQVSPALEDRLNKIEQSLIQIQHNEIAKPAPAIAAMPESEATSKVIAKPVSHKKKPAKHKPVHQKTVHYGIPPVSSKPAEVANSWVLRAATPGEAWVAADAHTTELKHVQVGDSLPGIGAIRTIHQTPGGWEIEGTTGTIR